MGQAVVNQNIPRVSRIITTGDSVLFSSGTDFSTNQEEVKYISIEYSNNDIIFEMSPDTACSYQYLLEGFERQWSPWRNISFKEYTNLPAGKFTFRVRYIISGSDGGELPLFIIRVKPIWYKSVPALAIYAALVLALAFLISWLLRAKLKRELDSLSKVLNKRTDDLMKEKAKTEELLARVLPRNTASEIIEKGKATKIKYNFVTVLFSDIQGFTKIAEEMNPEVLIDELDKFFFYFDSVVEKYGIEKIKTIGDAYMCAGGIPEKNRTNPVEVILAALEMRSYMARLKATSELAGMKYWDIRIGIHTGTVVAGVVGQKKLSYDIWGDTVNTASRMESSGDAGKINISGTTYEFVKEFFTCEYRGKMPVKYKGELEMYFVNGIKEGLSDENGMPNDVFLTKVQMIKLQDVEDAVLRIFDEEASPNLYFHNSALVRNVSTQTELLCKAERIGDEDYLSLKLASLFLFTGYINDYENPRDASLAMLRKDLPKYGFSQKIIDAATLLISNSYDNKKESASDAILHDAHYDYMGRVDYAKLTARLLRELTEYGKHTEPKNWIELQIRLLYDNDFLTDSARLVRNVTIEEQVEALKQMLP